ncbi:hypothetical protein Clacol_003974 [Clathrus columnatus]|uniref:Major facilitator superfamily (MFS) profile domain-containing protein n=1 Tax=Clathrus columnatus TaxID=1419009 RepID=A0AAV5A636_9AGAM|nr:hypothetical protein Clacol_003974 [Clathrus columnatus]
MLTEEKTERLSDDNDNDYKTTAIQQTTFDDGHTHSQSIHQPLTASSGHKPPFSIYTIREKWIIIALAGLAGLFSPLTANSYFPAIQTLANAFHTSVELINVTITVYMVLQGVSPMLWGTLSDRIGRRPLFIICLSLLCVSCVGLALVPTNAYWLLLLLRCFQAAGSASTIALGSGTISDIAEPSERGGFLGLFSLGPLIGPCIGPIIGGVLAGSLGWRFFPETLRVIVGNGSIPASRWNVPLIPILTHYSSVTDTSRPPPKKFVNPFKAFQHPSIVLLLLYNGTVYSVFYGVTATLSELFMNAYPSLTESEIGLCFLAVGVGCAVGSYMNGRLLDLDFKRIKRKWEEKMRQDGRGSELVNSKITGRESEAFPFEYARLRTVPLYVAIYAIVLIGYGWSIQQKVHIACPLILQFIIGLMISCLMNAAQTLLLDLFPTRGSSITAANNLVRCTMGATLVSIVDFILKALNPGWTFTLFAGICIALLPMNWAVVHFGPKWRRYNPQD